MNKYYDIFRRNFTYVSREDKTINEILENKNNIVIEKRNEQDELMGVSIINKNTILMLCVDEQYRNKGLGTILLNKTEKIIKENGYDEIKVGVGFDYLAPGIPTSKKYYDSENERLYSGLNTNSSDFFEKRGYIHSWDCNCFDMFLPLKEFDKTDYSIGSVIDGILYRWATIYLKDIGLTNANLSYTYTGMDHMYGYSGYKISCYYMMARKKI